MRITKTLVLTTALAAFALLLWGSGAVPSIIPQAVPAAFKQGNSTKFQLAGTNSGATGQGLCNDANGNTTTSSCTTPTLCTPIVLTGQTASIALTNITCGGAQATAGIYNLLSYMETSDGGAGAGTVAVQFTWHSAGGVKQQPNTGYPAPLWAITANNFVFEFIEQGLASGFLLHHDGTTHITFETTKTSTGTYDVYITLTKVQ